MGAQKEMVQAYHSRRRRLLVLYMTPGKGTLTQRQLTHELRRQGFNADSNSTNADLRWFRRIGIELSPINNHKQKDVDKVIQHWKDNNF